LFCYTCIFILYIDPLRLNYHDDYKYNLSYLELWAIALPHFEKLRMAKLICPPPLFLALNLRKKNVYYYISMKAYIVQIANGIRVCFETIVTVLKIYQTNKEYILAPSPMKCYL
jgi:hypothetical protein